MNMVIFLAIISVLIFVHELGHFWVARRSGVKVEKFSLGFGPKLLSRRFGDTEYMVSAIPFGGYIKMAGDTPGESKGSREEFLSQPPGRRARIIFAGPFSNYLLAFFCLWFVFFLGYPQMSPVVGEIIADMPAQEAGLEVKDRIVTIDGAPVSYWTDISKIIRKREGEAVTITLMRDGKILERTLNPRVKEIETVFGKKIEVALIGIKPSGDVVKVRHGFLESMGKGFMNLLEMTGMTLLSILYLILGTMSFKESVTGPIGIFSITSAAAQIGFSAILHVVGILSMSLAIFNLLPLPILDGGHIVLAGIEKIRRRPLAPKVEEILNNTGMVFFIVLTVFILGNDLMRYGYWDKVLLLFHPK